MRLLYNSKTVTHLNNWWWRECILAKLQAKSDLTWYKSTVENIHATASYEENLR